MKKVFLLLILILSAANFANAESLRMHSVKRFFNIPPKQTEVKKPQEDEGMTQSEQAVLFYNDNDIKNAFDSLMMIKDSDRSAQDWVLLGNILQDQGKNSDAVFMYQRAVNVDESYYKAYYNMANIYLEDEKPYLAIENYRKTNKANNKFPYAYYNLGCAYLRIGDLKKAKIAFLKAIELKNTEANFHYNLAYTYKMMNKPKLAKQYLDNYNKLIESNQ